MAYGFEVKNDDGYIIIDDTNRNFQVYADGTAAADALTQYRIATVNDSDGNDWGGKIPDSGPSGWGDILKSDLLFGRPDDGTDNYNSTDVVKLNMWMFYGTKTNRTQRKWGRFTITNTSGVEPTSYNYVQVAPFNGNGNVVSASSSGYGLEVYDATGSVRFTSNLDKYFVLDAVLTTSGTQSTITATGDSYQYANEVTFTAPSGADIYDYYVCVNSFDTNGTAGSFYGMGAHYQHSTRTIRCIASGPSKKFLIGRLVS